MTDALQIASDGQRYFAIVPALANRHGLISGATGTGKTVSLQLLAERFSSIGVPVFMADVKGDLAGLAQPGASSPKLRERLAQTGIPAPAFTGFPVTLWDVFGEKGHPLRMTVSDMGPMLLGRLLGLNDTQQGVLQMVFRIADDQGLLLLDMRDLRTMLQYVGERAKTFTTEYGNVSAASIGAIQRALLALDSEGASQCFGEPMLATDDLMRTDAQGRGVISILAADRLMNAPRLYGACLLWLLSELFEHLPEVGDLDRPRLVLFFDEAHLLFDGAPAALLEKIEQVVRLIRSRGVGVYFVTQNPLDVPDAVLGQLGNRIQHALRAFTPRDQKAVRAAAQTMRQNPGFDAQTAITELGVGEALLSFLDERGRPGIVERGFVLPPASRIGPLSEQERRDLMRGSPLAGVYDTPRDRESAHERLSARGSGGLQDALRGSGGAQGRAGETAGHPAGGEGGSRRGGAGRGDGGREPASVFESIARSAARSIGAALGRELIRGVLGSLSKRR